MTSAPLYLCPVCREWAVVGQLHREKNDGVSGVCKGSLTQNTGRDGNGVAWAEKMG